MTELSTPIPLWLSLGPELVVVPLLVNEFYGLEDVPDDLDIELTRAALLNTFPSFAARFDAMATFSRMIRAVDEFDGKRFSTDTPVLLLSSTMAHPVFDSMVGTSATFWGVQTIPHTALRQVHACNHINIPYTEQTGREVVQFVLSVLELWDQILTDFINDLLHLK